MVHEKDVTAAAPPSAYWKPLLTMIVRLAVNMVQTGVSEVNPTQPVQRV